MVQDAIEARDNHSTINNDRLTSICDTRSLATNVGNGSMPPVYGPAPDGAPIPTTGTAQKPRSPRPIAPATAS